MRTHPGVSRRQVLRSAVAGGTAFSLATGLGACGSQERSRLVFLNWQDYIDPTILNDFTTASGLQVVYETYASNDELAGRLNLASASRRRGRQGSTFDLIVPSDNLLHRLRSLNELQELDRTAIANLGNLDDVFRRQPFDPGNRFSIPWASGTTGIGYDTTRFETPPDWEVFFDASRARKMTLLDEMRDAFGVALFALGEDPNTRDPAVVARAEAMLVKMKAAIHGFDSATYLDRLTAGELDCAQAYSSDVLQARERNPKLAYVAPRQGAFRWIDSLCIPADAPNPAAANRFIDFYLSPEISATNAVTSKVNTGNLAARAFIPPATLADPTIFPSEAEVARLHFITDLGDDEQIYDEAWTRVKAAA